MVYRLIRPLLFALGPERAHELAAALLGIWTRLPGSPPRHRPLARTLFGLRFPSPIGLAAGMDKGRVLVPAWFRLGFGFVEVGTITPLPQPGNERPRLFRLPAQAALINRMGFNNEGAAAVAARLAALPPQPGPVGINIGRNKATPNERAADDYLAAFRALAPRADYVAVNVSSPNTPGLRALQSADALGRLLETLTRDRDALAAANGRRVPILVKLSPDEPDDALDAMAAAAVSAGADGLIATNTTLSRAGVDSEPSAGESGGLSGLPLRTRAERVCARLYLRTRGKTPIVGVGGIGSAEDAYRRIRAGASLVQIYTAFVYEGPSLPRRIESGLANLLERDGLTLEQATGKDAQRAASRH
ncbi:MAG: quinone-dependent dihydroorotate dehydrogenase [Myxococcales bacterium]